MFSYVFVMDVQFPDRALSFSCNLRHSAILRKTVGVFMPNEKTWYKRNTGLIDYSRDGEINPGAERFEIVKAMILYGQ